MLGLLLGISAVRAAPTTRADAPDVVPLISALTDRDSAVRERATEQLKSMGVSARPALLKAIRSGAPERRARAAELLLKLPWSVAADPPGVQKYLSIYGEMDIDGRKALVKELYDKLDASDVLLRLLLEEPSDDVRWIIVALLGRNDDDPVMRKLREADLSGEDAPVVRLAGQAWYYHDRARSLALLRKAIEAEAKNPSDDQGQLDFAFEKLIDDALGKKDFNEAAAWLRQQVPREMGGVRTALPRLMILHAYFPPVRGLEDDLLRWVAHRDAMRKVLDAVKKGAATKATLPAELLFNAVGLTLDERLSGAYFLFEHNLVGEAEDELAAIGKLPVKEAEARDQKEVKTQLLASMIYAHKADDQKAADALQQAMILMTRSNLVLRWRTEDDLWAEVYWRRARAAKKRGDGAALKENVYNLLRYSPTSSDTAIEIVNWLNSENLLRESNQFFGNVYGPSKQKLDASKQDPVRMNDLAWLCARCDQRLPEAVELATKAVAAKPESAAFLDTAAEANFKAGNRKKAVELETKALKLRPLDEFMQAQLKRFKAAAATAPASPHAE
jgi:hypothetical protein